MCMIDIMPKKNLELHIVRQSQICCPAAPKAVPTCKREQWIEEPVTGAVNEHTVHGKSFEAETFTVI